MTILTGVQNAGLWCNPDLVTAFWPTDLMAGRWPLTSYVTCNGHGSIHSCRLTKIGWGVYKYCCLMLQHQVYTYLPGLCTHTSWYLHQPRVHLFPCSLLCVAAGSELLLANIGCLSVLTTSQNMLSDSVYLCQMNVLNRIIKNDKSKLKKSMLTVKGAHVNLWEWLTVLAA